MSLKVEIDFDHESKKGVIKSDNLQEIREHFSCSNKSRQMAKPNMRRFIPKRNYLINEFGKFPIGMMNEIFNYCKTVDPNILKDKRFSVSDTASYYYEPSFNVPNNFSLPTIFEGDLRTIQEEAFKRIFKRGRGVIDVGTGGGKSWVIIGTCDIIRRYNPSSSILIYVPSHLCKQLYDDFLDHGFKEGSEISMWASEEKNTNFNAPVLIASMTMCINKANKEKFDTHCKNRNVCLIDECHRITVDPKNEPNATTRKVRELTTNNIIGFTGTVPIDHEPRWMCLGTIGKVIYKVTDKELKDKGYKASSKICAIQLKGSKFRLKYEKDEDGNRINLSGTERYNQQKDYLIHNDGVNKFIKNWVLERCKRNTIIPVSWDDQEDRIYEEFKDCGRKVVVMNGRTPKKDREKIFADLEKEEDTILIYKTKTLAEGISINNLHFLVGYYIGKAYTTIIQSIGRIERKTGDGSVPIVFDFYYDTNKSKEHFAERESYYKKLEIPLKKMSVEVNY